MEKLIFVIIAMVEHITVDPFELWWYKILLALSVYPFTFNVGLNVIIIITDPRFIIFIKLTMVTFITCIINIITLLALKGIHRPPLSASKTTTWTVSHNIFTIIPSYSENTLSLTHLLSHQNIFRVGLKMSKCVFADLQNDCESIMKMLCHSMKMMWSR